MKPSSEELQEVLKQSVVEHFLSGYTRILKEGGLLTPPISKEEISIVSEPQLELVKGSNDTFKFNSDFKVKDYSITFHGTVNTQKEIKNEAFYGKKN